MYIGMNVCTFAKNQPDKVAIYSEKRQLTYKQLYTNICTIKHNLLQKSSDQNHHVMIQVEDNIHFLQIYFSIISLGWVAIPIDQKQTINKELIHVLKPSFIVTDVSNNLPIHTSCHVIQVTNLFKNKKEYIDLINSSLPTKDDYFYIGQTSGSTSDPKFFIRTHDSWLQSFKQIENIFSINHSKTICAPGPLAHSLSLCAATYAIHQGATFYTMQQFSADLLYTQLKHQYVQIVFLIPTMLYALAKMPPIEADICFISGGDTIHTNLFDQIKSTYKYSTIFEYYGASEVSYITYKNRDEQDTNNTTAGKAFPTVQITICDENGEALSRNQIGTIYVQSPMLFDRYISNHTIQAGPYGVSVGDIGFLNDEQQLTIVGREKNMIISSGHNIYPEEIESFLQDFTFIQEAIVLGIPHPKFGELTVACIQLTKNSPFMLRQIRQKCKHAFLSYKRPKKYFIMKEFPRTHNGKIARNLLLKQIINGVLK